MCSCVSLTQLRECVCVCDNAALCVCVCVTMLLFASSLLSRKTTLKLEEAVPTQQINTLAPGKNKPA